MSRAGPGQNPVLWTHLEQVGAAEEHEVDPGHGGELGFRQGGAGQQRGREGDPGQRVHPVLKVDLQGREEEGGVQVDPDPARFSAHTGHRLLPEARRCLAPKRR